MGNPFEKFFPHTSREKEATEQKIEKKPKIVRIERVKNVIEMEAVFPEIGKRLVLEIDKVRIGDFEIWKKYGRGMAMTKGKEMFREMKEEFLTEGKAFIGGHFREINDETLKSRDIEKRLKKGELILEEGEKYQEGISENLAQDFIIKDAKTKKVLGKVVRIIEGPREGEERTVLPIVLENFKIKGVGKARKFDGWIGKHIKAGKEPGKHPVGHTYLEGQLKK